MHIVDTPIRATFTVLHVSDTHLSPTVPDSVAGWSELVRYTERSRPDLLVHTGDLVFEDPDSDADHEAAAFHWRRLTVPARVIPGNHDIGDTGPDPHRGTVSDERLGRFRQNFGADRWHERLGNWLLIGLNAQLFSNGLDAEEQAQWEWFDELIQQHSEARVAVFIHKPPFLVSLDEASEANKTIGPDARARLLALAHQGRLKLIGCGHLHEYMTLMSHDVLVVAAPSLTAGARPVTTRGLGLRCDGIVEYTFDDTGVRVQLLYRSELGAPPAIRSEDV